MKKNEKNIIKLSISLLLTAVVLCASCGILRRGLEAFSSEEPIVTAMEEQHTAAPTQETTNGPAPVPTAAPTPTITPEPTAEPTPTPAITPEPTPVPTEKPTEKPVKQAVLMFTGDLMCLSAQQYMAAAQAKDGEKYDFSPSFKYVKKLLSSADLAVGNLETTLSDSAPYAIEQKEIDGKPNCNGPKEYLNALKYAGFDALVLANNHCLDAGSEGADETVKNVDEYGFLRTGLFLNKHEKRYVLTKINGIRIALLSYSDFYNGNEWSARGGQINKYSKDRVKEDIEAAKSEGADIIIVYEHWGREHTHEPTDVQKQHAKEIANAGADIIIGSHSHCMQPRTEIKTDDGRKVICVYSLGNFVSSMSRTASKECAIAETVIEKKDGKTRIIKEKYHPCRVISSLNGKSFVVLTTDNEDFPSLKKELKETEERVLGVLKGKDQ